MSRVWRWLGVFALGASVGAAAMLLPRYLRRDPARRFDRMLDRFSAELQLRPDQKEKVAAIFQAQREKADALHAEFDGRFEALRSSTTADIRGVLDPDQQQRFDRLRARWEARRFARRRPGSWR